MNFLTFQRKLDEFELEIFTIQDVTKITDQTKTITRATLSRWVKENKLYRIKKGYYSLRNIDSKFQLQCLYSETYIGINSSLEYYGSTTQRFTNLDLISKKILHKQTVRDTIVNFHKIKEKHFFGFEKVLVNNTWVFVSSIEKTLIDCIYFSSIVYLTEISDFIKKVKNDIDVSLLLIYLNKIDSSILNKRIGYLLELQGILLKNISINSKYEKLNKNLSEEGIKNKKWKLIINEEL